MISSTLPTLVTALGNDVALNFPFTFPVYESEDLGVKVRKISDGVETALVPAVDYSVSGIGQPTGSVTLVYNAQAFLNPDASLKTGYELHLFFIQVAKQTTRYRDLGRHAPVEFEKSLDRIVVGIRALIGKAGAVGKSIKMPSSLNTDDFDPTLPSDFNTPYSSIMVNEDGDGFVLGPDLRDESEAALFVASAYEPSAVQNLGAAASIAVTALRRQHVRVKSSGGERALSNTPFGTNPALFRDGMEIVVEAQSDVDFLTLAENDNAYGFIGNGGLEFRRGTVITFIYSATLSRFLIKSLGAW